MINSRRTMRANGSTSSMLPPRPLNISSGRPLPEPALRPTRKSCVPARTMEIENGRCASFVDCDSKIFRAEASMSRVFRLWDGAQILAQNLADVRLRQRVQEPHLPGHFVCRQLPTAVRDQVRLGERCARRPDHEKPDRLAGLLVRDADAGALGDAGTGGSDCLHLVRKDVETGDDDHVLLAIDDLEVA